MIQDSQAKKKKKKPLLNISLSFKKKLIHITSCNRLTTFVKFITEMTIRKTLRECRVSETKYYLSTGNNIIKSIKTFRSHTTVLFRRTVKCLQGQTTFHIFHYFCKTDLDKTLKIAIVKNDRRLFFHTPVLKLRYFFDLSLTRAEAVNIDHRVQHQGIFLNHSFYL